MPIDSSKPQSITRSENVEMFIEIVTFYS